MRFHNISWLFLAASSQAVCGFTATARIRTISTQKQRTAISFLASTTEKMVAAETTTEEPSTTSAESTITSRHQDEELTPLTEKEINARLGIQLKKMQAKDSTSIQLTKEDLQIVFEDDDLLVVDKQSGVLSVPGKIVHPSLAQAVFDAVGCEMGRMDMMVVHRLGMDTSGLMVFAKTMDAVRGMNEVFRTRSVEKKYEAMVCGHIAQDSGIINLPLMRDYEFPPFMRVSTYQHQVALAHLDPEELNHKHLLEQPKEAVTKYEVISREEVDGQPVTRVALTSMSGRTHQLNVHLAAFGHPIVGDTTYGIDGDAAPNGGLTDAELDELIPNTNRASERLQRRIAATGKGPCVHAKSMKFRHPRSKEDLAFITDAPFQETRSGATEMVCCITTRPTS